MNWFQLFIASALLLSALAESDVAKNEKARDDYLGSVKVRKVPEETGKTPPKETPFPVTTGAPETAAEKKSTKAQESTVAVVSTAATEANKAPVNTTGAVEEKAAEVANASISVNTTVKDEGQDLGDVKVRTETKPNNESVSEPEKEPSTNLTIAAAENINNVAETASVNKTDGDLDIGSVTLNTANVSSNATQEVEKPAAVEEASVAANKTSPVVDDKTIDANLTEPTVNVAAAEKVENAAGAEGPSVNAVTLPFKRNRCPKVFVFVVTKETVDTFTPVKLPLPFKLHAISVAGAVTKEQLEKFGGKTHEINSTAGISGFVAKHFRKCAKITEEKVEAPAEVNVATAEPEISVQNVTDLPEPMTSNVTEAEVAEVTTEGTKNATAAVTEAPENKIAEANVIENVKNASEPIVEENVLNVTLTTKATTTAPETEVANVTVSENATETVTEIPETKIAEANVIENVKNASEPIVEENLLNVTSEVQTTDAPVEETTEVNITSTKKRGLVIIITIDNSPYTGEIGFRNTRKLILKLFQRLPIGSSVHIAVIYSACDDITTHLISSREDARKAKKILLEKKYKPNAKPNTLLIFRAIKIALIELQSDIKQKMLIFTGGYEVPVDNVFTQVRTILTTIHKFKTFILYLPIEKEPRKIGTWKEVINPKTTLKEFNAKIVIGIIRTIVKIKLRDVKTKANKVVQQEAETVDVDSVAPLKNLTGVEDNTEPKNETATEPESNGNETVKAEKEDDKPTNNTTVDEIKPEGVKNETKDPETKANKVIQQEAGKVDVDPVEPLKNLTGAGEGDNPKNDTTTEPESSGNETIKVDKEDKKPSNETTVDETKPKDNDTAVTEVNKEGNNTTADEGKDKIKTTTTIAGEGEKEPEEVKKEKEKDKEDDKKEEKEEKKEDDKEVKAAGKVGVEAEAKGVVEDKNNTLIKLEKGDDLITTQAPSDAATTVPEEEKSANETVHPTNQPGNDTTADNNEPVNKNSKVSNTTTTKDENDDDSDEIKVDPKTASAEKSEANETKIEEPEVKTKSMEAIDKMGNASGNVENENPDNKVDKDNVTDSGKPTSPKPIVLPPKDANVVTVFILDGSTTNEVFAKAKQDVIIALKALRTTKSVIHVILYNDNKVQDLTMKSPEEIEATEKKLLTIVHVLSKPATLTIFKFVKSLNLGDNTRVVPVGKLTVPKDEAERKELEAVTKFFITKKYVFTFVAEEDKMSEAWKILLPKTTFIARTHMKMILMKLKVKQRGMTLRKLVPPMPLTILITLDSSKNTKKIEFVRAKKMILRILRRFVLGGKRLRLIVIHNGNTKVTTHIFDAELKLRKYMKIIRGIKYDPSEPNTKGIAKAVLHVLSTVSRPKSHKIVIAVGGYPDLAEVVTELKLPAASIKGRAHWVYVGENAETIAAFKKVLPKVVVMKTMNVMKIVRKLIIQRKRATKVKKIVQVELKIKDGFISTVQGQCLKGSLPTENETGEESNCKIVDAVALQAALTRLGIKVSLVDLKTKAPIVKEEKVKEPTVQGNRIGLVNGKCPGGSTDKDKDDMCTIIDPAVLYLFLHKAGLHLSLELLTTGMEVVTTTVSAGGGYVSQIKGECLKGSDPDSKEKEMCKINDFELVHKQLTELGFNFTVEQLKGHTKPQDAEGIQFGGGRITFLGGKCPLGSFPDSKEPKTWCIVQKPKVTQAFLRTKDLEVPLDALIHRPGISLRFMEDKIGVGLDGKCLPGTTPAAEESWCKVTDIKALEAHLASLKYEIDIRKYLKLGNENAEEIKKTDVKEAVKEEKKVIEEAEAEGKPTGELISPKKEAAAEKNVAEAKAAEVKVAEKKLPEAKPAGSIVPPPPPGKLKGGERELFI